MASRNLAIIEKPITTIRFTKIPGKRTAIIPIFRPVPGELLPETGPDLKLIKSGRLAVVREFLWICIRFSFRASGKTNTSWRGGTTGPLPLIISTAAAARRNLRRLLPRAARNPVSINCQPALAPLFSTLNCN